jgi:hypothetical protein
VGAAAGVGADQHLASDPAAFGGERQLPQRIPGHRDVIGSGVRPGVARPQHDRQWFTGALGSVVNERAQRMKAIPTLECGCRVLLPGVRVEQGGVQIDDQRVLGVDVVVRGVLQGQHQLAGDAFV